MNALLFVWDHWLIIAFLAPVLWAMTNIIDVYFVHSAYRTAEDGTIISGLFQLFPWLLVFFGIVDFSWPPLQSAFLAMFGGAIFLFSFLFYFRTLFAANDVALLQVLWNLSVPLVPALAWIALGERLAPGQYIGIATVFGGATILAFDRTLRVQRLRVMAVPMSMAVLLLSLSMVVEDHAYQLAGDDAFWSVYLLFSAGNVLAAVIVWIMSDNRNIFTLVRKHYRTFFAAELLALFGFIASQRAIDISPSVSFVAAIESLVPACVVILSLAIVGMSRLFTLPLSRRSLRELYREQTAGLLLKGLAIVVMAMGIYWIS
jgi:drug/metabolite transporter (DMT)-like permease